MRAVTSDSGNDTASSRSKSALSYCICDYGLVVVQRMLICFSVILGYDLLYTPRDLPQICLLRMVTRIVRNFFFITKAIRKWLAINYNDGVIPEPPIRGSRSSGISRSTPRDSALSSRLDGSLIKHSPIDRRYTEPAKNFDLATALKERHNRSDGTDHRYYYADNHSSDFLAHSSLSFRFLLNGLAQSFIGNIEDPDQEMNRKEEADSHAKNTGAGQESKKAEMTQISEQQDVSENHRRNDMVAESVLDNDAELEKQQQQQHFADVEEYSGKLATCPSAGRFYEPPLPALNFDETIATEPVPVLYQPVPVPSTKEPPHSREQSVAELIAKFQPI